MRDFLLRIKADALKPVVESYKADGKPFKMGMVFPVSTHNYEIRYWLASAGINPGMYTADNIQGQVDADVLLSVTPPPQMPATLEAGTIYGYCVGEPWNQQAVFKGIGVPVVTNYDIWKNNPEKVFVMILSMPDYVGADSVVIANSMTGTFEFEKGDKREMPDFNVFYRYNATYPFYSDGVWFLTQMRRWGQIPEAIFLQRMVLNQPLRILSMEKLLMEKIQLDISTVLKLEIKIWFSNKLT